MATTKQQIVRASGIMIGVIILVGGIKFFQIRAAIAQGQANKPPPDTITAGLASAQSWPRTIGAVGSIAATQGVVLSAEESGKVAKINFESGAEVEAGTVLVELDTSVEEANLRAAAALWEQARANLDRARTLRAKNANSQADLDSAVATERSTGGAAESLKAVIARKKIVAPFRGRTGIRQVNVGQFLNPGTPVVPLYSLDPVFLNFMLPQQSMAKVANGNTVQLKVDAFPNETFEGKITTINPQVDPTTRNVELQATVPNPGERLRPGMYAQITLVMPESDQVIAVPASSISYAPYSDGVYVVEKMKGPDGNEYLGVRRAEVKVGERKGDLIAITSPGVKAGDQIATSGVFKLRPGAPVSISTVVEPGSSANPKPADT